MTAAPTPEPLTHARIAPLVGEAFTVGDESVSIQAELLEATVTPNVPDGWPTVPFSLLFRGPTEPALPQATYSVSHDRLGTEAIFIVPIAADATGVRYQAIFT